MTDAQTIFGMKIIKAAEYPKMTLAEDVTVSPEFRKEINAWMLGFFGTTSLVKRGEVIVMQEQGTAIVHPDDYYQLKINSAVRSAARMEL